MVKNYSLLLLKHGEDLCELGGDATYHMKGLGSISFNISLDDVVYLDHILYVPNLMKSLF